MTATITFRLGDEPVEPTSSSKAHLDAAFEDGSHVLIFIADATPDEDGQLAYVTVVDGPGGDEVFYGVDLYAGDDGQIDYARALRTLLDIWMDYADEPTRPGWWSEALDAWVFDHLDELDELHHWLLTEAAAP